MGGHASGATARQRRARAAVAGAFLALAVGAPPAVATETGTSTGAAGACAEPRRLCRMTMTPACQAETRDPAAPLSAACAAEQGGFETCLASLAPDCVAGRADTAQRAPAADPDPAASETVAEPPSLTRAAGTGLAPPPPGAARALDWDVDAFTRDIIETMTRLESGQYVPSGPSKAWPVDAAVADQPVAATGNPAPVRTAEPEADAAPAEQGDLASAPGAAPTPEGALTPEGAPTPKAAPTPEDPRATAATAGVSSRLDSALATIFSNAARTAVNEALGGAAPAGPVETPPELAESPVAPVGAEPVVERELPTPRLTPPGASPRVVVAQPPVRTPRPAVEGWAASAAPVPPDLPSIRLRPAEPPARPAQLPTPLPQPQPVVRTPSPAPTAPAAPAAPEPPTTRARPAPAPSDPPLRRMAPAVAAPAVPTPAFEPATPAPTPFGDPDRARAGSRIQECPDCPELLILGAATLRMGAEADSRFFRAEEAPARDVTIAPFALALHEVTRGSFARFVGETGYRVAPGCEAPAAEGAADRTFEPGLSWRSPGFRQTPRHPVVCISWDDAQAYIRWLNSKVDGSPYRLPTEAEQEFALRGGPRALPGPFPWGEGRNRSCDAVNGADGAFGEAFPDWAAARCEDGYAHTAPTGSFRPNAFGLFDMAGNALEWGEDCWNPSYANAPADSRPWIAGACDMPVLRGGSWRDAPEGLRAGVRYFAPRDARVSDIGFRVARELPLR